MREEIRTELLEFIATNYLFGDTSRIPSDEESLIDLGIIDSTGILELIEFLESRFGIEVTEVETVPQNLGTIGNIVTFVAGKRAVAAGRD